MASDTEHVEHGEKPVREQLRKARISHAAADSAEAMAAAKRTSASEEAAAAEHTETKNGQQTTEETKNGERTESAERNSSPARKRSFEEVDDERERSTTTRSTRHHSRKRSRDSTAEEADAGQRKVSGEATRHDIKESTAPVAVGNGKPPPPAEKRPGTPDLKSDKRGEAAVEEMASPQSKRTRLHSSKTEQEDAPAKEASTEAAKTQTTAETSEAAKDAKAGSKEVSTEEKKEDTKIPPTSGFANTSASSPFASLQGTAAPPAEKGQTSASAFASSGFGALAGSTTSGFGALGKSTGGFGPGGGFGSGAKSPLSQASTTETDSDKPKAASASTFGGALGEKSAFSAAGNTGSSFGSGSKGGFGGGGKLGQGGGFGGSSSFGGTGFGSLAGNAAGLTSFASGKPSASLAGGSKSTKAFGAPPGPDDEEEGDDKAEDAGDDNADKTGLKSPLSPHDSDKQDERFYEQDVETGEENEQTEFQCRAKLYNFAAAADNKKEWKERGLGVVRLNVRNSDREANGDEEEAASGKPRARLLMRAEGSHRVILNTPVKKEIRFGSPEGLEPKGGYVYFMGAVDGKSSLELLQLKVRQQSAQELCERIKDLQAVM